MADKVISIITDWGGSLGFGHVQRMANVLSYINQQNDIKAYIINKKKPDFFSPKMLTSIIPDINPESLLIIRDMRDSSADEILELKKMSRVLVIDDNGEGRVRADHRIDLLPNPLKPGINSDYKKEFFLYGYNFTDSIKRIDKDHIKKNIDAAIYLGHEPSKEYFDYILSLLPESSITAVLTGNKNVIVKHGIQEPIHKPYSEIILSSKVLITHFGITLYEGYISRCRLITINPAEYHSGLADMVKEDMNIGNLGVYNNIDPHYAHTIISDYINNPITEVISSKDVFTEIQLGLDNFCKYVLGLLSC